MNVKRTLVVASIALLLAPALIVIGPASALDRVGDAPQGGTSSPVYYTDVETTSVLFLRDIAVPGQDTTKRLGLSPEQPPTYRDSSGGTSIADRGSRPRQETYLAMPPNVQQAASDRYRAKFAFDPNDANQPNSVGLRHDVVIRGANSIFVQYYIQGTPGLVYEVSLFRGNPDTGAELIAFRKTEPEPAAGVVAADRRQINVPLELTNQRTEVTLKAGEHPTLTIIGYEPSISGSPLATQTGSWTLVYDEPDLAPSRVEIRATNALQVATWTQTRTQVAGESPAVSILFRNFTGKPDYDALVRANKYLHQVDGRYAARSAWGVADLNRMTPTAEILNSTLQPIKVNPWKTDTDTCANRAALTSVPLTPESSNDVSGVRLWRFQRAGDAGAHACLARDFWYLNHTADADGKRTTKPAGGEYLLRVKATHQPSKLAQTPTLTSWRFQVSAVQVSLQPFVSGTGTSAVTEVTSHPLAKNGLTTFLLNLTNKGAANDTIRVTVNLVSASPPTHSWIVDPVVPVIGRVDPVGANLFRLGPGNSTVLAITVRAPATGQVGESATFSVTAQSMTDPAAEGARSDQTLTAGPIFDDATKPALGPQHAPRVIFGRATEPIVPGSPATVSGFVWNRYAAPQTINVGMDRTPATGWKVDLLQNNRPTKTLTLQGVPAGGLVGFSLAVEAERGLAATTHTVDVNATLPAGTVPKHVFRLTFVPTVIQSFEVRILEGLGGDRRHVVETFAQQADGRDFLDGTWYRVWITNNQNKASFKVSAPTIVETPAPSADEASRTPVVYGPAQVYHRDFSGKREPGGDLTFRTIEIESGATAEVYVWVEHNPDLAARPSSPANPIRAAEMTIRIEKDPGASTAEVRTTKVRIERGFAALGSEARPLGVAIEPVVRCTGTEKSGPCVGPGGVASTYSATTPYIDTTKAGTTVTTGAVGIGKYVVHRMRITNGASWWMFEDPVPGAPLFWDHRVNVTVSGVDVDTGWATYFRLSQGGANGAPPELPTSCSDPVLANRQSGWATPNDFIVWPPKLRRDGAGNIDVAQPVDLAETNGKREGFWDGELEVLVCAPPANFPTKPLAGQFDQIQVRVQQIGPRALSATAFREITTTIAGLPAVVVTPRVDEVVVPVNVGPSERDKVRATVPIFIANNGSYLTNVTIEAKFANDQPFGWTIVGTNPVVRTPIRAFENMTVAFSVKPPSGTAAQNPNNPRLQIVARYLENLYDPSSRPLAAFANVTLKVTDTPQDVSVAFGSATAPCSSSNGNFNCTAQLPQTVGAPRPTLSIPLVIQNTGTSAATVTVTTPTMPGWVFSPGNKFSFNQQITVPGSSQHNEVLIVTPPKEAVAGSFSDIVITVRKVGDNQVVSTKAVRVAIQGGLVLASLEIDRQQKFVERNNTVRYPITLRNEGNEDANFTLEPKVVGIERAEGTIDDRLCRVDNPDKPCWESWVETLDGTKLTSKTKPRTTVPLKKNELVVLNLTVRAPFFEQENAYARTEMKVWNALDLAVPLSRVEVRSDIQDYGVQGQPSVDRLTLVPGLSGSMLVLIKNTGDANDTLNLSLDTGGLPWRWSFSSPQVFLTPGSSTGVRLTIQSPTDPLPAPRTAKFWIYVGTRGGQQVNVSLYDSKPLFVTVPEYRQLDVDRDNITELAVDRDADRSNGFEEFYEYSSLVRVTKVVDKALGKDRHYKFLLDVPPSGGTYDNTADRYWDPDQNIATDIVKVLDLDKDQTPDYLIDSDGDGVVDTTYQAATRQFLKTDRVKILGSDAGFQYLIDTNGDAKPDRYYDPAKNLVTRLVAEKDLGVNVYGVDTDDDGRVDVFYDYRAQTVTPAAGVKIVDFAREYWYVFAGFLAVVVLFGVVLMRRKAA